MSALAQPGSNVSLTRGFQSYTPVLSGTTDNPVPTFTTQVGRFTIFGPMVLCKFKLVSTTMTKTTLTDLVQISLPMAAATNSGEVTDFLCRVENATAVANMIIGEIASGASVATLRNYALAASSSQMTYAVTTPGIGVLTNTITINGTAFYEYAAV